MNKRKKICFIINTLSKGGGAERTVENLANYYIKENYDVTIVQIDKYSVGYIFDDKVKIISLDFKKDKNFMRVIYELGKLIKKENFDYVFSLLFRSNIFNILSSLIFKIKPIIISERSFSYHNYSKGLSKYLLRSILRYFYSKADKIIAISEGVKESLLKELKVKTDVEVIYNPIILSKYTSNVKSITTKEMYNFITIGRLIESKNQKLLIDVIEILNKKNINSTLTIIGDGILRDELNNYILQKKLEQKVKLLGYIKNPETFLKEADLFLFASKYEAFGNVLLEAMREGLPIISFKSEGGPTEILNNGTYGVVINEFSANQMAEEIIDILNDVNKYTKYSKLSLERVKYFSVDRIANEYLKVYDTSKYSKELL